MGKGTHVGIDCVGRFGRLLSMYENNLDRRSHRTEIPIAMSMEVEI